MTDLSNALDHFIERYLALRETDPRGLPRIEWDPDWPSPCYQGQPDANNRCGWQPIRQNTHSDMFSRLSEALGDPVHADLVEWYSRYWSDPLPARCAQGRLSLLFVWNPDDYERLRANLIGHLLDARRHHRPDALFFACTEPEDYVLSLDNQTGEVLLEQPGTKKFDRIAASMADFIAALNPELD